MPAPGSPCPDFGYAKHPLALWLLRRRNKHVLKSLATGRLEPIGAASDTRTTHEFFFRLLTPRGYEYYAGHYRGENFPCLEMCQVGFGMMLACDARQVDVQMNILRTKIRTGLRIIASRSRSWSQTTLAANLARFSAEIFASFISIHPYKDGNGHMGRFIVCAAFIPHGHYPQRWTIDPRPTVPHLPAIRSAIQGNPVPLMNLIISCFS